MLKSLFAGGALWIVLCVPAVALGQGPSRATALDDQGSGQDARRGEGTLKMSPAVVCDSIEGYEDYKPLPGAALTSDEKLLVYHRPYGYKTALINGLYQAHITEDGQIRKRGGKAILFQKLKMVDYTPRSPQPPRYLYMRTLVSLKGLGPGEYDLVLILHDEIAKGPPATQVVKFRVIPPIDPRKKDKSDEPEQRAAPGKGIS